MGAARGAQHLSLYDTSYHSLSSLSHLYDDDDHDLPSLSLPAAATPHSHSPYILSSTLPLSTTPEPSIPKAASVNSFLRCESSPAPRSTYATPSLSPSPFPAHSSSRTHSLSPPSSKVMTVECRGASHPSFRSLVQSDRHIYVASLRKTVGVEWGVDKSVGVIDVNTFRSVSEAGPAPLTTRRLAGPDKLEWLASRNLLLVARRYTGTFVRAYLSTASTLIQALIGRGRANGVVHGCRSLVRVEMLASHRV